MLFKPTIIIYLQRNGLLVAGRSMKPARFVFPAGTVDNLEIEQRDKFITACQQFFKENELHGKRVLLVLDYSVVFEKTIALDKAGQPETLLEGFVAAMPFEPGKRACLGVETGSQLRLFATNAELYNGVAGAFVAAGGGALAAITPIAAYNLGDTERTVSAATEHILKDTTVEKQANFQDITAS